MIQSSIFLVIKTLCENDVPFDHCLAFLHLLVERHIPYDSGRVL